MSEHHLPHTSPYVSPSLRPKSNFLSVTGYYRIREVFQVFFAFLIVKRTRVGRTMNRHSDLSNMSSTALVLLLTMVLVCTSQGADIESRSVHNDKKVMVKLPTFSRATDASVLFTFGGFWDNYLRAISDNWLKVAPDKKSGHVRDVCRP